MQYSYNADGEVTSSGDAGTPGLASVTLDYTYDADGNRTSMSDSLGGVVSYTYDARDELINETLSGTGISAEAVTFAYDNAGNMTGQTRYSNLAETTVVASTSYTYDSANQMTGITDKNSSGTTLVSYGYTYDAAGRVTQEVARLGIGLGDRHADLRATRITTSSRRDAHQRVVRQRELLVGRQRQPDGDGLHDEHGQRADGLAGLHVHLRRRRQHDHVHADVDRRRVDVLVQLRRPDDRRRGEDVGRDGAGAGDVHVRCPWQPDRDGREWDADLDALRRRRRRSWTSTGRAPWKCGI